MAAGNTVFKSILIPDGIYRAVLPGVHRFENIYGARIGFEFTLTGSALSGATITHTTSSNLNPKSKLYATVRCLLARELTARELNGEIDWDSLKGSSCRDLIPAVSNKSGFVYSGIA